MMAARRGIQLNNNMPRKELPFGYTVEGRDLGSHMPRKVIEYKEAPAPVVNVVPHKSSWEVIFDRDEYGRIKSPITIKPKT